MRAAPSVGEYRRIYDPSAGQAERWYVNDHTLFRDRDARGGVSHCGWGQGGVYLAALRWPEELQASS